MSKTCSGKRLVAILAREYGFMLVGQRGSHVKLRGKIAGEIRITIVPLHSELARGTLKGVIDLAGLDFQEVLRFF